jgi:hypothetical protein
MNMTQLDWNNLQGKSKYSEKTCPSAKFLSSISVSLAGKSNVERLITTRSICCAEFYDETIHLEIVNQGLSSANMNQI